MDKERSSCLHGDLYESVRVGTGGFSQGLMTEEMLAIQFSLDIWPQMDFFFKGLTFYGFSFWKADKPASCLMKELCT